MANYVSRFRPGVSVLCITPNITAARQASGIMQGIHTIWVDSLEETDELIDEINFELVASGMVKEGDQFVLIAGRQAGMKEQMRVVEVNQGKSYGHIMEGGGFYFNRKMILNYSKH